MLDLHHPEGARIGMELSARADVVIENFLPGGAAELGIGYDAVRARKNSS